jgi:hypothetical protein
MHSRPPWRSPIPKRYVWPPFLLALLSGFAALFGGGLAGCAKSSQLGYPLYVPGRDYIPVEGSFSFMNQCPFGNLGSPTRVKGGLWNCPLGSDPIGLLKSPPELLLQGDCRKRLLTVRTFAQAPEGPGGSVPRPDWDTTWELRPDGTFSIEWEQSVPLILSRDSANAEPGAAPCGVAALLRLSGQLVCDDPDRPLLKIDTHWDLTPESCRLPPDCYLHATAEIRQCN